MREGGYEGRSRRVGTIVQLTGRVDATTVTELRERLHSAVDGGVGVVILDLSDVELIDATGLAMLVGTHRRALRAGRELLLRSTPARIHRLLVATGLDRVLPSERPSAA